MLSLPATPPCPPVQAHCLPHNNKHPGRSVPPLGSRAGTWSQCTWFWRKFLMAVLFCRQNFHHTIFLSSDYLLKNIFSDGDLFFVIRLFTRKIFGDLPSWPSPLHRVHSRLWVHLFKNCECKDIQTQKELKNWKYVMLTFDLFQNYVKKQNITLQVRTAVSPSSTRRGWAPVDTRGKSANIALLHLAVKAA